jgi:hypothetical protein
MKTKLFPNISLPKECTIISGIEVSTLLGKVFFEINSPELCISNLPHQLYLLENEIQLHIFDTDICTIETLISSYELAAGDYLTDRNLMQIFRMEFKQDVSELTIQIKLVPDDTSYECYSNCGEYFEAVSFESNSGALTIGTNDTEYLGIRASNNDWLPNRWKNLFGYEVDGRFSPVKQIQDGILTTFPTVYKKEKLQVSYTMSWTSSLDDSFDTKKAADISIKKKLTLEGIEY